MEASFTIARTTCNLRAAPKQTLGKLELCSESLEEQEKNSQINIQSIMCEKLMP